MTQPAYYGTQGRTFAAALLHLLESDYGLLGSRKVLELLVGDVAALVEQFYPPGERLGSGWMIFTGTRASGGKVHPGQYAYQHELVSLAWPVLMPEDLDYLSNHPECRETRQRLAIQRMIRLIEYGWSQPEGAVLLTEADLAALLQLDVKQVSRWLAQARQETGKPLVTKGYYFDQGMKPTHKAEIVALYESGLDEVAVARRSGHALKSVGQYLADYERVKRLLQRHTSPAEIAQLLQMTPSLVAAYTELAQKYHPELAPTLADPDPALKGDK